VSGCVFGAEWASGHGEGDGDLCGEGFGEAVGVDNVAVECVFAGRHDRQRDAEVSGCDELRMEMESGVHLRLANGVEVHEVTVVGQEVVVGASSPFAVGVEGMHVEVKLIA